MFASHTIEGQLFRVRTYAQDSIYRPTEIIALRNVMHEQGYPTDTDSETYQSQQFLLRLSSQLLDNIPDLGDIRIQKIIDMLDKKGRGYGYNPAAKHRRGKTRNPVYIAMDINRWASLDFWVHFEQVMEAQRRIAEGWV